MLCLAKTLQKLNLRCAEEVQIEAPATRGQLEGGTAACVC